MIKRFKKLLISCICILTMPDLLCGPAVFAYEAAHDTLAPQSYVQSVQENLSEETGEQAPTAVLDEFIARMFKIRDLWRAGRTADLKTEDEKIVASLGKRSRGAVTIEEYDMAPLEEDNSVSSLKVKLSGMPHGELEVRVLFFKDNLPERVREKYRGFIRADGIDTAVSTGFYSCSERDYNKFLISRREVFLRKEREKAIKRVREHTSADFQAYIAALGGPENAKLSAVYDGIVGGRNSDLYGPLADYLLAASKDISQGKSYEGKELIYRFIREFVDEKGSEGRRVVNYLVRGISNNTLASYKEIRIVLKIINLLSYQEALPLIDNIIINTKMRKITADTRSGETIAHVAGDIREELKKFFVSKVDRHNYFLFFILARYLPKVSTVQNELDAAWTIIQDIDERHMQNAMSREIREAVHGHIDKDTPEVVKAYITYIETGDTKGLNERWLAQKLDEEDRALREKYAEDPQNPPEVYKYYVELRDNLNRVFEREVSHMSEIKEIYRASIARYPDIARSLDVIEKHIEKGDSYNASRMLSEIKSRLRTIIFDMNIDPETRMDFVYIEEDCTYLEYLQLAEYLKEDPAAKEDPAEAAYRNFDLIVSLIKELGDFGIVSRETQELCELLSGKTNRFLSRTQIKNILFTIFAEYKMIISSLDSEFRDAVMDIFKKDEIKTYQFLNAIVRRGYLILPKLIEITQDTITLLDGVERWEYRKGKLDPAACERLPLIKDMLSVDPAIVRKTTGCKGSNLVHMELLGLPVPPGFFISSEFSKREVQTDKFKQKVKAALKALESEIRKETGEDLRFGDPVRPLIVSVRAAGIFTMPGILQTTVNVGMNDEIAAGMVKRTGNPWFVYDTYRRFIKNYATNVMGIPEELFMPVIEEIKNREGVELKEELTGDNMREVVQMYKKIVRDQGEQFGKQMDEALADPFRQLVDIIEAAKLDWDSSLTKDYVSKMGISRDWNLAIIVQSMVFGNKMNLSGDPAKDSLTIVCHSREYNTFRLNPKGEMKFNAQGDDIVSGETGLRGIKSLGELRVTHPELYKKICEYLETLDTFNRAPQEMELTVEDGRVYILQTRSYSFKKLSERELAPVSPPIAKGFGIGGGGFRGVVSFSGSDFEKMRKLAKELGVEGVILLIDTPLPKYTTDVLRSDSVIAHRGGATSHLAISCQENQMPGIFGIDNLQVKAGGASITMPGREIPLKEGDVISIDSRIGEGLVYEGKQPIAGKPEAPRDLSLYLSKENLIAADKILKEKNAVGILFGDVMQTMWRLDAKEGDLELLKGVQVIILNPGIGLGELSREIKVNWFVPGSYEGIDGWVDDNNILLTLERTAALLKQYSGRPPGLYLLSPNFAADAARNAVFISMGTESFVDFFGRSRTNLLEALNKPAMSKIGRELFSGKVLPYPKELTPPATPERPGTLKVPGTRGLDEDYDVDEDYLETVLSYADEAPIPMDTTEQIVKIIEKRTGRAPVEDMFEIRVITHSDVVREPGILRAPDADRITDLVFAVGREENGRLVIYVTPLFYDEYLMRDPVLLAEVIDHEYAENIEGMSHRDAAARARFFARENGLSPYHEFIIAKLAADEGGKKLLKDIVRDFKSGSRLTANAQQQEYEKRFAGAAASSAVAGGLVLPTLAKKETGDAARRYLAAHNVDIAKLDRDYGCIIGKTGYAPFKELHDAAGENSRFLFEDALPVLRRTFSDDNELSDYWPDLVELGKKAGKYNLYIFIFGLQLARPLITDRKSLVQAGSDILALSDAVGDDAKKEFYLSCATLRNSCGDEWIKKNWRELVKAGKKAGPYCPYLFGGGYLAAMKLLTGGASLRAVSEDLCVLAERAGRRCREVFCDGLPQMKALITGRESLRKFCGDLIDLAEAAGDESENLFRTGLPVLMKSFREEELGSYWGGMVTLGKAARKNSAYLFAAGLTSVKNLFGDKLPSYWPGLVEIGEAAGMNSVTLFDRELPVLERLVGEHELREYWPGLVEMGKAAGEYCVPLFGRGGLPRAKRIFGADIKQCWPGIVALGVAAGEDAPYLFKEGLNAAKMTFPKKEFQSYWPDLVALGKAAGKDSTALYLFMHAARSRIAGREDLFKLNEEIGHLLKQCAGVEYATALAVNALSPLIKKYPSCWGDFIKPVIYARTQSAYLYFQVVDDIYMSHGGAAIASPADLDFIREIIEQTGVRSYDILSNFIFPGIARGVIKTPLSEEKSLIISFLDEGFYPVVEIYAAYKRDPGKAVQLKERCASIIQRIRAGDTAAVDKDPLFGAMLMHVFPPAFATNRDMYVDLYEGRPDRPDDTRDVPPTLQERGFDVDIGAYVLKDPSRPLDETPWEAILAAITAVNSEAAVSFGKDDMMRLGKELVDQWGGGRLKDTREELMMKLYRFFRHTRGQTLPGNLGTIRHIMALKQYIGETMRELVEQCVDAYRERYPQEYTTVIAKKFRTDNAAGAAKSVLEIVTNFAHRPEQGKERLMHILRLDDPVLAEKVWEELKDKNDVKSVQGVLEGVKGSIPAVKVIGMITQALQGSDYKAMQGEVAKKYEFRKEPGKITLSCVVSKRKAHGVVGFNMGVCVACDEKLWDNPDFMNVILFDGSGVAQGGMHAVVVEDKGRRYLTLPGINPSIGLLTQVPADDIYHRLIEYAHQLAKALKCEAVLIPRDANIHSNVPEVKQVIAAQDYSKQPLGKEYQFSFAPFAYSFRDCFLVPPPKALALKVPGTSAPDEEANADMKYVESILKRSKAIRFTSQEGKHKMNLLLGRIGGYTGRVPPDNGVEIRIINHPDAADLLGIPKYPGASSIVDQIIAVGRNEIGALALYVTKKFYTEHLEKDLKLLAEIVDHEYAENLEGMSHPDASRRAYMFAGKDGLSPYHRFIVSELAKTDDGMQVLRGIIAESKSGKREKPSAYEKKFVQVVESMLPAAVLEPDLRKSEKEKAARLFLQEKIDLVRFERECGDLIKRSGYRSLQRLYEAAGNDKDELFNTDLPALQRVFSAEEMERYWPDMLALGSAAGGNAGYVFRYGLPAVKEAFGEELKDYWPGIVALGKAAGSNAWLLFRDGVPALKDVFGDAVKAYWPVAVDAGKMWGPDALYLFMNGLPAVEELVKTPDDLRKVGADLAEIWKAAGEKKDAKVIFQDGLPGVTAIFGGELGNYWAVLLECGKKKTAKDIFLYGLPALRELIKTPDDLRKVISDLETLWMSAGEQYAATVFQNGLPAVSNMFGKELAYYWPGVFELGTGAGPNAGALFQNILPTLRKLFGKELRNYWPMLVECGKRKDAKDIFLYGLPALRDLIETPDDLRKRLSEMDALRNASGTRSAAPLIQEGLPAVKKMCGKELAYYWPGLLELGKAAGPSAWDLFQNILPEIKNLFGSDFKKYWPGVVRVGLYKNAVSVLHARLPELKKLFGERFAAVIQDSESLAQILDEFQEIDKTARMNGEPVRHSLIAVKDLIRDSNDLKKMIREMHRLFQLCAGVEWHLALSLERMAPIVSQHPSVWNNFIKPVIFNQTVGAALCFDEVSKLYECPGAIATEADFAFIRELIENNGIRSYDLLKNFFVEGVSNGVFVRPVSSEKDLINRFLRDFPYPIIEIYRAYKENPAQLAQLEQRCRAIHDTILTGDASQVEKDPLFPAILMHVFPPAVTTARSQYHDLYARRPDRSDDTKMVPGNLQGKGFEVSTGRYILKDPSKPLDETPWATVLKAASEGNKEKQAAFSRDDVMRLGEELISAWGDAKLPARRAELIQKLYRYFRYSRGQTLPDTLGTVANIMALKQFAGETIRELIGECAEAYRAADPAGYGAVIGKMFRTKIDNPEAMAKGVLAVLQTFAGEPEKGKEKLGRILGVEDQVARDRLWEDLKTKRDIASISGVLRSMTYDIQPGKEAAAIFQAMCGDECRAMQGEISSKYEFREGVEKIGLRCVASKRKAHGVAGLNMGVCVAPDAKLWDNPDFMNVILFDDNGIAQGGMHVLIIEDSGKRYLALPGINPSIGLMTQVPPDDIYSELIGYAHALSMALRCEGVLIPASSGIHSNRSEIQQVIEGQKYAKVMLRRNHRFSHTPSYLFQECFLVPPPVKTFHPKTDEMIEGAAAAGSAA